MKSAFAFRKRLPKKKIEERKDSPEKTKVNKWKERNVKTQPRRPNSLKKLSDLNRLTIAPSQKLPPSRRGLRVQNSLQNLPKFGRINSKKMTSDRKIVRKNLNQYFTKPTHSNMNSQQNSSRMIISTDRTKQFFDGSILRLGEEVQTHYSYETDSNRAESKRSIPIQNRGSENNLDIRGSKLRLRHLIETSASPATLSMRKMATNRSSSTAILIQNNFSNRYISNNNVNNRSSYSKESTYSRKSISPHKNENILKKSNFTQIHTTRTNLNYSSNKVNGREQPDTNYEVNFSSVGNFEKKKNFADSGKKLMKESRRKDNLKHSYSVLDFKLPRSRDLSGKMKNLEDKEKKFFPNKYFGNRSLKKITQQAGCKCEVLSNKSEKKRNRLRLEQKVKKGNFSKIVEKMVKELKKLKNETRKVDREMKKIRDEGYDKVLKVEKILKTSSKSIPRSSEIKQKNFHSFVDRIKKTPRKSKRRELSLNSFKRFRNKPNSNRRINELTEVKAKKTKSLTNISFTAQKLKFDLKAISFQIEKISRKYEILLKQNFKNKTELEKRYKLLYQNQQNSNLNLKNCKELLEKNKNLKRKMRRYQNKTGKILKKKVKEIEDTCEKQLEMEVKLLEMRYVGGEDLIKKDLDDYVNFLLQRNFELKRAKLARFQFN